MTLPSKAVKRNIGHASGPFAKDQQSKYSQAIPPWRQRGDRGGELPILIKVERRVCHPEEVDDPRTEMPPKELVLAWQLF